MKTLRTYGNLAEAGFAKSLLDAAGIPAELADEQMYAIGYGSVVGGLRLQVDEEDLERAIRVLEAGPDANALMSAGTDPTIAQEIAEHRPRFPAGIFLAVVFGFGLLLFAAQQWRERQQRAPVEDYEVKHDSNGDGRVDTIYTYRGQSISTAKRDRNRDGKFDEWQEYNSAGLMSKATADNNFDGRRDDWLIYDHGELQRGEFDVDFNGIADMFAVFRDGLIQTSEIKPNGASVTLRRQKFIHGILSEAVVDTNQDGVMDYRVEYDPFGNESPRIPIEAK